MTRRFEGKVAIVTGSSNGIGRATAQLFAGEGAKVTITGRSDTSLQTTFDLLISSGASPDNIIRVIGNLTDEIVQKRLVDETVAKFGRIDILVNNAGGLCEDKTSTNGFEQPTEAFDYVMNLNLKTVLTLTKLALPHLIEAKGEVIMVSSICAMPFSNPAYPYYSISKAALDQMTRSMAATYILKKVRINSVNPGWVCTDIMRKQGLSAEVEKEMIDTLGHKTSMIPIGRPGQPREIAEFIAFLADRSKSEFIVGQCMAIDGGSSLLNPMFNAQLDTDLVK